MNKILKMTSLGLLLTLSACNGAGTSSGQGGGGDIPASGNLEFDAVATVPVLANRATTTVIYLHNTGDGAINNLSYTVADNVSSATAGTFTINQNSCPSIAAHSSCALEFTTPQLAAKTASVHGSALIKASYSQNGTTSTAQQLVNYTLLPAPTGIAAMTDVNIQGYQFGTVYLYAESGSYDLESMTASIPELREVNRSAKLLNAPQVVAVELLAGQIDKPQNVQLDLQYQNQEAQTKTLQTNIMATPTATGAILTAGQVPLINTAVTTSGQMLVYNSGNEPATLGSISGTNGITILSTGSNRCATSLAAGASCNVYFTVPQAANNGTITIPYDATNLVQSVDWYNGVDQALLQMVVNPTSIIAYQNAPSDPVTVSLQNIGGYDITGLTILAGTNLNSGNATTATSTALSCKNAANEDTGTTIVVGGSCSYAITITDAVTEANKNMSLGITGSYTKSSGATTYQRKSLLGYTTNPPAVTITSTSSWQAMMGSQFYFTASIKGGPSTVTPTTTLAGATAMVPTSCALNEATAGAESCMFYVNFTPSSSSSSSYPYWDPANIATSTNVSTPANAYSYSNISLTVAATCTGTTINGTTASSQVFTVTSGKVIAPYVYLASPESGAAGAGNYGISWGAGGVVVTRFSTYSSGADCVKDNLTGLIWPKNGIIGFMDGSYVLDQPIYTNITVLNNQVLGSNVLTAITNLNSAGTRLCGINSWRVPTINELLSLANYGTIGTVVYLNNDLFSNIQSSTYWSGTVATTSSKYFVFHMADIVTRIEPSTTKTQLIPVYGP